MDDGEKMFCVSLGKCALRDSSAISKSSRERKGCHGACAAGCGGCDLVDADMLGGLRSSLMPKHCSGRLLAGWYEIVIL